jgi:hypothetical protein
MAKRFALGVMAVFAAWTVAGIVIHGLILGPSYEATAQLWRPMEEMNNGLMSLVMFIMAILFTLFYTVIVTGKSPSSGVKFGLLSGLLAGFSMGFGTYTTMPITFTIAIAWFLGTLAEYTAGGWLVGLIVKPAALKKEES